MSVPRGRGLIILGLFFQTAQQFFEKAISGISRRAAGRQSGERQ